MNKFQKDCLFPLLAVSFVCFLLKLPFKDHPLLEEIGNYTSLHYTFSHFQFFAVGLIARKHMNKFETLMNSQLIMTLAILLMFAFFWLQLEIFRNGTLPGSLGKVLETMIEVAVAYPTVYIMFCLFHRYYKPNFLKGSLEYVGKRTLDIYLIHYFFYSKIADGRRILQVISQSNIGVSCGICACFTCCRSITYRQSIDYSE